MCVFQVAMSTMDNPLLKYNAKEYFFKASLCHFIVDELNAKVTLMFLFWKTFLYSPILNGHHVCVFQLAIEKYEEMFPAFTDSRELKLLKVIHIYLFLICFRHVLSHTIMRNKWNSNSNLVAHFKIYWSLEFGQKSLWSKYSNVKKRKEKQTSK